MPENKGYANMDKAKAAKTAIRQNKEATKGKGTEEYGNPESVSDPWRFMEKGIQPKKGPEEF